MGRKNKRGGGKNPLWLVDEFVSAYNKNLSMLINLAQNRFKWIGLPSTCDERFLQRQLLMHGNATICFNKRFPDVWQTLIAAPFGEFDVYGVPVKWNAYGHGNQNSGTQYEVTRENGVFIYYSNTRMNPWPAIEQFARKLAFYERAEIGNLSHQLMPWVFTAPEEKKLEVTNLMFQVLEGKPAVIGDRNFTNLTEAVTAINTGVPFIGEELARGYQNTLNQAMLFLGIPHLAFEKGERMIEDEARANTAPTSVNLLNCLDAQRKASHELNERFGLETDVVFNEDLPSLNYNYVNNVEALAQDGMLSGGDGDVEPNG